MKHVGVIYYPQRQDSSELAEEVTQYLQSRGVTVWQGSADDGEALRDAAPELDLLITMGGDGTIVHAVRCVSDVGLPILGMNLGRLGFLTEVEPAGAREALARLLEGDFAVEERMMLRAVLRRDGEHLVETKAINDLVVARGVASRTVHVSVGVDGHHVMTPAADGVIVSTPTGSTAYCLAAGGPIVAPDLNCLTITPIAAHLGIAHAFVVPARRSLCLELVKGDGAMLTVDGQSDYALQPGDTVCATASANAAKFIRFGGEGYFYETVLRRLRWLDRQTTV